MRLRDGRPLRPLLAVPVLLAMAACQAPTRPVPPTPGCDLSALVDPALPAGPALVAQVPGTMAPLPLNTVSMTDPAITNKVLVRRVDAVRTAGGTLEVQVGLLNCTDFPLQVEGRAHFMGPGNTPSEPPTAWGRVFLSGRTLATWTGRSIGTAEVTSFLVELREGG